MFAGNFAPRGWALCDGQLLAISQFNALFSILGTTYGGDGRTTFALPGLRGRVPVHPGNGPGLPPVNLGQKFGTATTLLTTQNLPNHEHTGIVSVADGNGDSFAANAKHLAAKAVDSESSPPASLEIYKTAGVVTDKQLLGVKTTGTTGAGNVGFSNQQPSLGLNYIIALQGIFPSRN